MPIHDWTRVTAGTFHAFHNAWITHLQETLNNGLLPSGYYALGEQRTHDIWPDVLTLEEQSDRDVPADLDDSQAGAIAVAERPPKVQWTAESDAIFYLERQRSLVIRHTTGDRIVAIVEIVSPANKASQATVEAFLDKAVAALQQRYHLLVIDLHPPTSHDPQGIPAALWAECGGPSYAPPEEAPLALAAYASGSTVQAYIEPVAVGRVLPEMPLFLRFDRYINTPLEETYAAAWRGVLGRWRRVIEAP